MDANEDKRPRRSAWPMWILAVVLSAIVGSVSTLAVIRSGGFTASPQVSANTAVGGQTASATAVSQPTANTVTTSGNADVVSAVKAVMPAIVVILNYADGGSGLQLRGEGSGIVFDKMGYIITNNHVVEGAAKVGVLLPNGDTVEAKVVGTDPYSDLGVLQIPAASITAVAKLGNSDALEVGETAIAIGNPLGQAFNQSVTVGVISATRRTMPVTDEATGRTLSEQAVLQTDAAINPGNSGGALCNIAGEVIGVNSSKIAEQGVEGMGFAIPINEARQIVDQIIRNGHVDYPALGIAAGDLLLNPGSMSGQNPVKSGVIVGSVNSPEAKQSGLQKGDVIVEMDGQPIPDSVALHVQLFKHKIGDTVQLTVIRQNGSKVTIPVKLTSLSSTPQ